MKKIYLFFGILILFTGCTVTKNVKDNSVKELEKRLTFIDYNQGYRFGNIKNARIVIVEYSSYECSKCRNLHKNIGKVLKKYIDNGNLLYIYKPVDHPKFENDQKINQYFEPKSIDDIQKVFDKFDLYSRKPYSTVKSVLNLREQTVTNYESMNKAITTELKNGNVTGTPTMYINGIKYKQVFTKQQFQKILDSYLD